MVCEIIDFRCVLTNELIGSPILTVLLLGVAFFALASYRKFGIKTTLWLSVVYFPVVCYYIAGTGAGLAFVTFVVAIVAALIQTRIIGNR